MHILALKEIIGVIRKRYSEGDFPVDPSPSSETLENAILDLADQVDKARLEGMEDAAKIAENHSDTCFGSMYSKHIAASIRKAAESV